MIDDFKKIRIEEYRYELPEDRIAKFPVERREDSKLLLYLRGEISETIFHNVQELIKPGTLLVFNNTKVIHARLFFKKATGTIIEIFCLEPYTPAEYIRNFSSISRCEWRCMVGNLKRWKEEMITTTFRYEDEVATLRAVKIVDESGSVIVRFEWDVSATFSEVLEACGHIPIPPYLNRAAEEIDNVCYQTVYSKEEGSVAAPTAGLHFTLPLLDALRDKGVDREELTLHVGAGTFKPVKSDTIGDHDMHTEHFSVSRQLIEKISKREGDVTAVGTTSVRTLETIYWMGVKCIEERENPEIIGQWEIYSLPDRYSVGEAMNALLKRLDKDGVEEMHAATSIIIVPGYHFRVVSGIFTNFHQPQSTLLLLVAAAIGEDWRGVYSYALEHDFRFLSYGDSSFLKVVESKR